MNTPSARRAGVLGRRAFAAGGRDRPRAQASGFTLIELLLVVTVVAVLSAIAFPAYQGHVESSRRMEAKAALQEAMNRQERHFTANNTYTDDMTALGYTADPVTTSSGWYEITAAACDVDGLVACVELTATPQQGQADDRCGTLTLDSRGRRDADAADCW